MSEAAGAAGRLTQIVEHAAHLLPAQGPISIFVHHNTLHAFEHLPFEQAVVEAGQLFGCQPWLSEERYREELERGRITEADLDVVLDEVLGDDGDARVGPTTRRQLRRAMLLHPIEHARGAALEWILAETPVLQRFRPSVPVEARLEVVEGTRRSLEHGTPSPAEERAALRTLFEACLRLARAHPAAPSTVPVPVRHRDLLLAVTGEDADALIHPVLIRVAAAFLDQGLAMWQMPWRERGLYRAFLALYGQRRGPPAPWLAGLPAALAAEEQRGLDPADSAVASLVELGVPDEEWPRFLEATVLALRGWAGMIRQVETRPDRLPALAVPARLVDLVAVRLLLDRFALRHVAGRALGRAVALGELRALLAARLPVPAAPQAEERAFLFFQLAQVLGFSGALLDGLGADEARALVEDVDAFGELERRRLLHRAYERRYRAELLDALSLHAGSSRADPEAPPFQAVFCLDEREESLRRHLEEVEPACETFGSAGFFGVAMYYRGAGDARPMPLCPVVVRPENEVEEVVVKERQGSALRRARARRLLGRTAHAVTVGSRSFARGAVLSAVAGSLAALPLVWRVLFPRSAARLRSTAAGLVRPPAETLLALDEAADAAPTLGARMGFSLDERAAIVKRLLEDTGLAGRLAPLVLIVGHGSSSLNNPHESAYECGACGGGRGGPNARAFAMMANDPRVRARLAATGLALPSGTWFVGALHNTCADSITFFDTAGLPDAARAGLAFAQAAFDQARARNAHERCRRFESAPLDLAPAAALAHVETRGEDLAQPRPECGHATNAACLVGRRARTRGLYLDRRVFLVSYDPTTDDETGTILERVLQAVAPVCAGINLEYYFSYVDPYGYGCQSKLPHNLASLLGVMDGHVSDLRPGLPWQMVEVHEPLRLLVVIEQEPALISSVLQRNPTLERLVTSRWIGLSALSPQSGRLHRHDARANAFVPYQPVSRELPVVGSSLDWYRGRREHLRCARIVPGRAGTTLEPAT